MSTGTQLKYNGISHYCLKYAKVADIYDSFTAEDVKRLFGHKFDRLSKINNSLEMLTSYRMLRKVKGGYKITDAGKDQLKRMARPARGGDNE